MCGSFFSLREPDEGGVARRVTCTGEDQSTRRSGRGLRRDEEQDLVNEIPRNAAALVNGQNGIISCRAEFETPPLTSAS